jgi:hypothetical protein
MKPNGGRLYIRRKVSYEEYHNAVKPQLKIERGSGGSSGLARIKKYKNAEKISENPLDPCHPRSIIFAAKRNANVMR